ncbi:MAG: sialidase family protein [Bacteroidota bacterium]
MKIQFFLGFLLVAVTVIGQSDFENVMIHQYSGSGYQPCEPSIAVDVTNPSKVVAGSILNNVYTSLDSGRTWTLDVLESDLGVFGDPCIISSPKGGFYYFHLSDPDHKGWRSDKLLDRIVCQYSKDVNKKWSKGSGMGLNGSKDQDKEWAVTSLDGKKVYCTWTQFDKYNSKEEGDSTLILFSMAKHKGKKWSEPVRISAMGGDCLDGDMTVEGAVPSVGPEGELYVAWALDDQIWLDRSFDGGQTWLEQDIKGPKIPGGWDHSIEGIGRANGMPVTKVDVSKGEHRGRIYINWADDRNGANDVDVWLAYSDDHGNTWSESVRVNDDAAGSQQFFTWMDVDPITGQVVCVFYDRRNYSDYRTDVYLAVSNDGGQTFENIRVSEAPFTPSDKVFFGDYNNVSAVNGVVRPIWTRNDNGVLSVWTALINL